MGLFRRAPPPPPPPPETLAELMHSLEAWTGRVQLVQELAALLIVIALALIMRRFVLSGGESSEQARARAKRSPTPPEPPAQISSDTPLSSPVKAVPEPAPVETAPTTPRPPIETSSTNSASAAATDEVPAPPTPKQMEDLILLLEETIATVSASPAKQSPRPGGAHSQAAARKLSRNALRTHAANEAKERPALGSRRNSLDGQSVASVRSTVSTASVRETLRRRPKDPFNDAVLRATMMGVDGHATRRPVEMAVKPGGAGARGAHAAGSPKSPPR
mmetsp:Transcript_10523/g.27296  ORF Transcript_10523/g.27296 Transcript_10523/m.27296 type:complete len:276 (+) Transcript_10523:55-882(+)